MGLPIGGPENRLKEYTGKEYPGAVLALRSDGCVIATSASDHVKMARRDYAELSASPTEPKPIAR